MISQQDLETAIEWWRAHKDGRTMADLALEDGHQQASHGEAWAPEAAPQEAMVGGFVPEEEFEAVQTGQVENVEAFDVSDSMVEGMPALLDNGDPAVGAYNDDPTSVPTGSPDGYSGWDDDENKPQ